MAYSLNTLRSQKKTSIYGRRLGLDQNDFLVGPRTIREQIEDFTTTAASTLANFGLSRLMATGSTQNSIYTLDSPVIGAIKRIVLQSSSSGCQMVKANGGALFFGCSVSTVGSTVLNFIRGGANVTLFAESSIAWRILNGQTSLVSTDALGFSFTTST